MYEICTEFVINRLLSSLKNKIPRIETTEGKPQQAPVPRAGVGSGFTFLFEFLLWI